MAAASSGDGLDPPGKAQALTYLKEKVDPLVSALVTRLVKEQPEDVLGFMTAWCAEMREESPEVAEQRQEVAAAFTSNDERPVTPPGGRRHHASDDAQPRAPRNLNFVGTLGGSSGASSNASMADRRAAALAAAERRSAASSVGQMSATKRAEMVAENKRQELVGKVRGLYQASGVDEPFGLGMATTETLEKHYQRAKKETMSVRQQQSRESTMRNVVKL